MHLGWLSVKLQKKKKKKKKNIYIYISTNQRRPKYSKSIRYGIEMAFTFI